MGLTDDQSLSDSSDEQLLGRYCQGDIQAFTVLVDRYRQELFLFLTRTFNNRQLADDVFQETFLQVHLSAATFDTSRRFRPWLFTIAMNKARDQLRRSNRRETVSLSTPLRSGQDGTGTFVDLMEVEIPLPDEFAQQQESRELVREVIEGLPPQLREVLLLAYFHRFSYKQIAEMVAVPVGTVKSRLHTAVGTFAKRWKSRFEGQP